MAAGNDVWVGPCSASDLPAVVELASACYGARANPLEWWRWRYFGLESSLSRIHVARLSGRVVGVHGMGSFRYTILGRTLTGALFTDVMVHPEHRGKGIFATLAAASVQEAWHCGADFVNVMPNDFSLPGLMKAGWTDLGDRNLLVCPLRPTSRGCTKAGPDLLSLLTRAPALRAEAKYAGVRSDNLVAEETGRFDASADVMAARIAGFTARLTLYRDSAWLNWRFCEEPSGAYLRIAARGRDGTLHGVAVTRLDRRYGQTVGLLVELIATTTEARRLLTSAALLSLRKQGAVAVAAVLSDPGVVDELCGLGFSLVPGLVSPKRFHTAFLPRPGNENLLAPFCDVRQWYLTLGDWDAI